MHTANSMLDSVVPFTSSQYIYKNLMGHNIIVESTQYLHPSWIIKHSPLQTLSIYRCTTRQKQSLLCDPTSTSLVKASLCLPTFLLSLPVAGFLLPFSVLGTLDFPLLATRFQGRCHSTSHVLFLLLWRGGRLNSSFG